MPVVYAQTQEAGAAAGLLAHVAFEDPRIAHLENYLTSFHSPLAKDARHIISEADRLQIDWKLIPAIAGVESTFCKRIPSGSHNCWGWGIPTGSESGIGFSSLAQGITIVSDGLRTNYMNRGAKSLEQIGRIYAASPAWASKVRFFIDQIDTFSQSNPLLLDVTI